MNVLPEKIGATVSHSGHPAELTSREFLSGSGDLAALIRERDWSQTPLGPIETWPQSLRTAVSLCLGSNFPINIIWGPGHVQIYNDGYRGCCGDAHPRALGEDYSVTWASAWPAIGKSFDRARAGETMYLENQRMFLNRYGYLEETFFTFSHSPIRDESGGVGGLFHPVTETTATMLSERRTRALRDLSASLSSAVDERGVLQRAVEVLSRFQFDLPFLALYALEPKTRAYRLAGCHGVSAGKAAAPLSIELDSAGSKWPVARSLAALTTIEVDDLAAILQGEPCGPYEEPPNLGFVIPIVVPTAEQPPAVLLTASSPRLPLTEVYRSFFELLSMTIAGALATVRALEDERRRAEALAEIDRAKTLFFSNVSHEFRTPLTLMLGPLEDALANRHGILPMGAAASLGIAHRNALRLMRLVNTLLDFSRIEADRVQAFYEPVDLASLTAELASNFRSMCEKVGLRLIIDCLPLPQGTTAYVDRDMWEKIVLNLLSNAFKFTLEGEIEVRLESVNGHALLTVRDTGVGIASEELPHMFERFHRIEQSRGRTHEGTGIGLALVQELVKLHGGTVSVKSVVGGGSAFTVAIPLGNAHLDSELMRSAPTRTPAATTAAAFREEALRWLPDSEVGDPDNQTASHIAPSRAALQSERPRVLWADDNADMRAYVSRLLGSRFDVQAVPDGEAALAAARARPPDLVLSDVMMPGLDGFGLLRALRADPQLREVPVILLSARAGEESRVEGLDAGADDYLIKPFTARELLARVNSQVKLARVRKESLQAVRRSEADLDRRQVELLQRVAEFETLFRAVPLGVAIARDPNCETIRINPAFAHLLGISVEENASQTRPDKTPLPFRVLKDGRAVAPRDLPIQVAAREGREIRDFEFEVLRADETSVFLFGHAAPLVGTHGESAGAIGVFVDNTERNRAARQREELIRELQRSNRDLSLFSHAISHDLQSPVNHVRALTQILRKQGAGQTKEEYAMVFGMIEQATVGMQRLIRSLLHYAQVGEGLIEKKPVPLNDVVDAVRATLSADIAMTGTVLACRELPTVPGDFAQLEALLQNLIDNAIKYRRSDAKPKIHISARVIESGWEIAVRDNGEGIPPTHYASIFTPLTRLNASTSGTGLGLASCHAIVERHGGRIWVDSADTGGGSVFHFTLPAV